MIACMSGTTEVTESMNKQKDYGDDDHIIEQAEALSSQKYSSQRLT